MGKYKYIYSIHRWHMGVGGLTFEADNMAEAIRKVLEDQPDLAMEPDGIFGGPVIDFQIGFVPEFGDDKPNEST